jgi:hypothetical protein
MVLRIERIKTYFCPNFGSLSWSSTVVERDKIDQAHISGLMEVVTSHQGDGHTLGSHRQTTLMFALRLSNIESTLRAVADKKPKITKAGMFEILNKRK